MPRAVIDRGWVRLKLIRELAVGEKRSAELGEQFGVTDGAIRMFAQKYRDQIQQVKADLHNEYAALWIAEKRNRVAEYEADVEAINAALDGETDDKLLRTKLAVMRQVAEELGQLTQKVEASGTVSYIISGIDPDVLK